MAETSWPSPNHNSRAVDDTEFEQLVQPTGGDGIVGTPSDTSFAYADASGMNVKIRADKFAVVRGRLYSSGGSDLTLVVTNNASGLTRVDLLVLRLTRATWDITSVVKPGTPGAGAPSLTRDTGTTGVFEIPIAEITVPSGDSSISSDQVTNVGYYLGEQMIVCTSSSRPSHAVGLRIYETNTGLSYISTGAAWVALQGRAFICTSSTRPSHLTGLMIFETDTSRVYYSTGGAWRLIGDEGGVSSVSANTGMTLTSQLYKRNGWTYMNLGFNRDTAMTASTTYTVGTVPSGFRPSFAVPLIVICPSGQSLFTGNVATDGTVTVTTSVAGVNATRFCQVQTAAWPSA